MKTIDCARNYVEDMLAFGNTKMTYYANSSHAEGNQFVSYSTPICIFKNGKFNLATKKYSVTTSKQQNYLRRFIPSDMLVEIPFVEGFSFRR